MVAVVGKTVEIAERKKQVNRSRRQGYCFERMGMLDFPSTCAEPIELDLDAL